MTLPERTHDVPSQNAFVSPKKKKSFLASVDFIWGRSYNKGAPKSSTVIGFSMVNTIYFGSHVPTHDAAVVLAVAWHAPVSSGLHDTPRYSRSAPGPRVGWAEMWPLGENYRKIPGWWLAHRNIGMIQPSKNSGEIGM